MLGFKKLRSCILYYSTLLVLLFGNATEARAETDEIAMEAGRGAKAAMQLAGPVRSITLITDGQPRQTINFDRNGDITERLDHYREGDVRRTSFAHDYGSGKSIVERYAKNGKLSKKAVYTFNQAGNVISAVFDNPGEQSTGTGTFEYDEDGRRVGMEITLHRDARMQRTRYVYVYDSKGNLTEERRTKEKKDKGGSDVRQSRTVKVYDDKGNKTEEMYYDTAGGLQAHNKYKYDKYGNVVEMSQTSDGLTSRQESSYEYDALGNWVKLVRVDESAFGGQPRTSIGTRKIVYYDAEQ